MSWMMHHSQSEIYAIQADLELRQGNTIEALELYRRAAEEEGLALRALDPNKTRTLGVTAVSVASLWYKARDLRQVERIAFQWLASDLLPAFALEQLRTILQTAWYEQTFEQSGIEFVKGEVLVSVSGGEIVTGGAPLDLIYRKVDEVRSLFYRTIEMLLSRPLRKQGPPSQEIQEQFRPWLLQVPPGSYQFAVRVQKPAQMSLFAGAQPEVEEITDKFLEIVGAASQAETHDELEKIVPDPEYRQVFLKITRNLAPAEGKSFDRLEIKTTGDLEARPVVLVPSSRQEINTTLRKQLPPKERNLEERRLTGVLRALHLDQDWLELKADEYPQLITVRQTGDIIDDLVGPMVNHRVVVDVFLRRDGRFVFRDIQPEE